MFFAKERDELARADQPNTTFFCYDTDDDPEPFSRFRKMVAWPAVSMATWRVDDDARRVVAIGPNGNHWELNADDMSEQSGAIAGFQGHLRRLALVGGQLYACGMGRVLLRRVSSGDWTSLGPGALPGDPKVVGFEAVAGTSEDEMYAVGWGGEIWWCDKGHWRRVDSPTSQILSALCRGPGGDLYAVGHDGVMVHGRHDQWALVDTGRGDNLRDVACIGGDVFVVTDFRLLKLAAAGLVDETDFADPDDRPATCLHLLPLPEGLVSLGTKDLFIRNAGPWKRLV
jgi:hypothetical protein